MADMDYRMQGGNAVAARIAALRTTAAAVARTAGVDPKTIRGLIRGSHWPTARTRARIEKALHWPAGEITRHAVGDHPDLASYDTVDLMVEVCRRIKTAGI